MERDALRQKIRFLVWIPLAAAALAGCASSYDTPVATTTTTTTTVAQSTVTYPEGRYQLYGNGDTIPYYWVWIPTGSRMTTVPQPPPRYYTAPPAQVVTVPSQTVVTVPPQTTMPTSEGYYRLYGDGVSTPYYWAWIPAGSIPPAPPPPPGRRG